MTGHYRLSIGRNIIKILAVDGHPLGDATYEIDTVSVYDDDNTSVTFALSDVVDILFGHREWTHPTQSMAEPVDRPFAVGDRVRIVFDRGAGHIPPGIPDGCVGRVTAAESEHFLHVKFRGGKSWTWAKTMFVHA